VFHPSVQRVLLLALFACKGGTEESTPVTSRGPVLAKVLDGREDAIGGPLARGRAGDILLQNDQIRLVLEQPERALGLNPYGGNVIDGDVVRDGAGQDRFGEVGLFLNAAYTAAPESVTIRSNGFYGTAEVVFEGPAARADFINSVVGVEELLGLSVPIDPFDVPELWITLTWSLSKGDSHATVQVDIRNDDSDDVPLQVAWLVHGGLGEQFDVETGGWTKPQFSAAGELLFVNDVQSYAIAPLPYAESAHGGAAMAGGAILVQDGSVLDILAFPDTASVVLAPGESTHFEAAFVVGDDAASVLATLGELAVAPVDRKKVEGKVTVEGGSEPIEGVVVAALDVDGRALGSTLTDASGRFEMSLPTTVSQLIAGKVGWPYGGGGNEPGVVPPGDDLSLPPTGTVELQITDGSGSPIPAHVGFVGFDPSPPHPALEAVGTDPLAPGIAAMADTAVDGTHTLFLEPGSYEVVITRGMEYDASIQAIEVQPGQTTVVTATLNRVLDTTGMLTGDFHVHSSAGPDTVLLDATRVANFAAEGMEILVASDHAFVNDLAPVVADLGLEGWMTPIPSQEVTTFDYGHFCVFPLVVDPDSHNQGAIDWVGQTPQQLFDWAHDQPREMVVQVNHPRAIPTPAEMQHYFGVLDLQYGPDGPYLGPDALDPVGAGLPVDAVMFDDGFTAVEVMTWLNIQGLSDWFNLLNAGHVFAATANSDTHTTRVESSGWPRNFIDVGHDDPSLVDPADIALAVNAQRLSGSFGPLVTLQASNDDGDVARMGDTLDASVGGVVVAARVQAAAWVPVDTLDLYADGVLVHSEALDLVEVAGAEGGVRFEATVELPMDSKADGWVAAVVHGSGSLFPYIPFHRTDPELLTAERLAERDVEAPATPFGFANPVYLDADGDGVITPTYDVVPGDWTDYRREDRLAPYRPL
jgi:hypothetical protein